MPSRQKWFILTCIACVLIIALQTTTYNFVRHRNESLEPHLQFEPHNVALPEIQNCLLNDNFAENLKKIDSLNFTKSSKWMKKLYLDRNTRVTVNYPFPVVVTASDSIYFNRSQGLVKSIHKNIKPRFPGVRLIYYDLGLTFKQRILLESHCQCEVRSFPFDKVPRHVKQLNNYSFKPLIVKWVYQQYGYIWWLDASIRFTSSNLDDGLAYLDTQNVWFYTPNRNMEDPFVVPKHTHIQTFRYFDEEPCSFLKFGEIQANAMAFRKSKMADIVLKQWAACALDKKCIDPPGAVLICTSTPPYMTADLIGSCHRYDQSALNLMLWRLFHQHLQFTEMPKWMEIRRGQAVDYFGHRSWLFG